MVFISLPCFASSSAYLQLLAHLSHFKTMQGSFTQVTYGKNNRMIQKSTGKFWLKRPLQFRWETVKPSKQIVITNGNQLWIYDVLLEQATEQKLPKDQMSPARLLSGDAAHVLKRFSITEPVEGRFILKPKKQNQNFKQVVLQFKKSHLFSISIQNSLLQTNVFQFSGLRMNQPIDSSLFYFKPPKGVSVMRAGS